MRDERRKEERSKQGQTNKAKQHSTPKAVTLYMKMHVHVHSTLASFLKKVERKEKKGEVIYPTI